MRIVVIAALSIMIALWFATNVSNLMMLTRESERPLLPTEQQFGNYRITLTPPAGYCALDAARPADARIVTPQQERARQSGQLLALSFVPCDELERFRQDASAGITQFGTVLTREVDGRAETAPGLERSAYLDSVEQATAAEDARAGKPGGAAPANVERLDVGQFGLAARDERAIYVAGRAHTDAASGFDFVGAVTIVNSVPLMINLGQAATATFRPNDLYRTTSHYVAQLVAANRAEEDRAPVNHGGVWFIRGPITVADILGAVGVVGLIVVLAFWPQRKVRS